MKSLTETQAEELILAITSGVINFCDLLVLGRFIYERRTMLVPLAGAEHPCSTIDKCLLKRVECATNEQAHRILAAIGRLPGLPG